MKFNIYAWLWIKKHRFFNVKRLVQMGQAVMTDTNNSEFLIVRNNSNIRCRILNNLSVIWTWFRLDWYYEFITVTHGSYCCMIRAGKRTYRSNIIVLHTSPRTSPSSEPSTFIPQIYAGWEHVSTDWYIITYLFKLRLH